MIYFDNAATTPLDENVIDIMIDIMKHQYGNASSLYSFGRTSKQHIERSRKIISECIGCSPEELIFTSGGSESNNYVFKGLAKTYDDIEIICSKFEHHSVINAARALEKCGCTIKWLPILENGMVDITELKNLITEKTKLVSVMMVNNELGTIQDIKSIVNIVKEFNPECVVHTDAVQAVGQVDIDVKSLGVDFLSASGHKFNAPKGIGFLYKKAGVCLNNLIDGGQQEYGQRAGTENVASIVGMAVALKSNVEHMGENRCHKKKLRQYMLRKMDDAGIEYTLNAAENICVEGCLSVRFSGIDAEGLLNVLDMNDICVSLGSACDSESKQRSHVLKAIGLFDEDIDSSIRITMGKYNTKGDVDCFVAVVKNYCELLGDY